MVILLATKQMGQKGILVSADNSCKIILRITVRIIPDFEHPEHFEMFQAPRSRHIYSSNALIKRSTQVYISSVAKNCFGILTLSNFREIAAIIIISILD